MMLTFGISSIGVYVKPDILNFEVDVVKKRIRRERRVPEIDYLSVLYVFRS